MSIEVNGHQLPPLLVKLIAEGKWDEQELSELAVNRMLRKAGLTAIEQTLTTISAAEMVEVSELIDAYMTSPQERKILFEAHSVASSKERGQKIEDDGIIDIDAVVFVVRSNSEYTICLDYREDSKNPCLRAYIPDTDEFIIDWRMIAPDFETFARELGLVE
jgi:hypothetical protein